MIRPGDVLIIAGQIGSGKTVQADILAKEVQGLHVSVGKLIRERHADDERVASGDLLPDDFVNNVVAEVIEETPPDTSIIFDGYPRTIEQKQWLNEFLHQHDRRVAKVIVLEVPEEEILQRLSLRGRHDDHEEAIQHRMKIYTNKVAKVVDSYEEDGLVLKIDGHGKIEDITKRITAAVKGK